MPRILVVEDDPASHEFLCKFLKREGHDVLSAMDGGQALEQAAQADMMLLDVMLPVMSGLEVAEAVRHDHPTMPILMLTALSTTDDEVRGLETGADDYITKPYDLRELRARIRALLRRSGLNNELSFGPLRIVPETREVYLENKLLSLSKVEYDLLVTLAQYPGHVFSRERLLERIWGSDYYGMDRVVDVRMVALRKKLGEDGREPLFIETVRGLGYRFKFAN
ncbi:MAG: response regulator transcription factor [Trueperaceae bacterium]|nr:response regulator transcription factor [Trueperaceae bacterium]